MNTPPPIQFPDSLGKDSSSGAAMAGYAALGLCAAGVVGIIQATEMKTGLDVLFCLAGSGGCFGTLLYLCLGKR